MTDIKTNNETEPKDPAELEMPAESKTSADTPVATQSESTNDQPFWGHDGPRPFPSEKMTYTGIVSEKSDTKTLESDNSLLKSKKKESDELSIKTPELKEKAEETFEQLDENIHKLSEIYRELSLSIEKNDFEINKLREEEESKKIEGDLLRGMKDKVEDRDKKLGINLGEINSAASNDFEKYKSSNLQ